ncbi:MAG: hypothetical protein ACYS6K_05995 [Planctomycetota bacterium]|jgi:hypothetical protein
MKQHPKRKDLARINVSIPREVYQLIKKESQEKDESLSVVVTKFLETYFEMRKKFAEK